MNQDQTELSPVGDEVMEARIVAWVLGQASPFEAAELERWCAEHPEWRVYQRRMLALHGLLGQASAEQVSEQWQLSKERRAVLDGVLGAADDLAPPKIVRKKRSFMSTFTKLAASLVLLGSIALLSRKMFMQKNEYARSEVSAIAVKSAVQSREVTVSEASPTPMAPASAAKANPMDTEMDAPAAMAAEMDDSAMANFAGEAKREETNFRTASRDRAGLALGGRAQDANGAKDRSPHVAAQRAIAGNDIVNSPRQSDFPADLFAAGEKGQDQEAVVDKVMALADEKQDETIAGPAQRKKDSAKVPALLAKAKPLPTYEETSVATEPYSTFSLRVSDVSFKLAQAAMAQQQRPAAESIRIEEFYNAFDYGDPVPTAKEPISCFMEQLAHPILPSRNLLRVSMRTAAAGRTAGQPLQLTLLVDQSGSMERADRAAMMQSAFAELVKLLGAQDRVSIIGFARTPRLIAENIHGNESAKILQILCDIPSSGGTNIEEALKLSRSIAARHQQVGAQNRILLITDGAANLGNANPTNLSKAVEDMRQEGLSFDIAGIGTDGVNDELLSELARHGNGRYYLVNDVATVGQSFATQLAGAFQPAAENVKVQVHFNSDRVSSYRLVGFEKDRLKTEDFRDDAVDAAELAAAEAGNAMYQIELRPDGRGAIGEVSVRFRDTASAQMVERQWTIGYQATAPAWDRATPSMQLAGLAMFTAEKLKGGHIGEMVSFRDWLQVRENVARYYTRNPRVGQLMEMIRQLEP